MASATIQSVSRIGTSNQVAVKAAMSDGSTAEFVFDAATDKQAIRQAIRDEMKHRADVDAQVAALSASLVGKVISDTTQA